jgi:hypothetical protein
MVYESDLAQTWEAVQMKQRLSDGGKDIDPITGCLF